MPGSLLFTSEQTESTPWSPVSNRPLKSQISPGEYLEMTINDIRAQDVVRSSIWQSWVPEPCLYPEQFLWERMAWWIEDDPHADRQKLKIALKKCIQRISFIDFQKKLSLLASKITENLWNEPYTVLFDDQPHKSKYWVWNLIKNRIPSAALGSHFYYVYEEGRDDGQSILSLSRERWINTYLILDDAVFSGQQIWHRILATLKRCDRSARVIVAAPYMTKKWIANLKSYHPKVECLHMENMLTIGELIPRKILLSWNKSGDTSAELRQDATLTYFDHRMADGQSFCQPISDILWARVVKPYDISWIHYYEEEDRIFSEYKERLNIL